MAGWTPGGLAPPGKLHSLRMYVRILSEQEITFDQNKSISIKIDPMSERTLARFRQQRILELLESSGGLRTSEVAKLLGVSYATARRDLDWLAAQRLIERTHGGALPFRMGTAQEPPFVVKAERMKHEKERIALHASTLVPDGATVILDSGTTALAVARILAGRRLTVVALDLPVAQTLAGKEGTEVLVPGGRVRNCLFSLVGPWAESELMSIYADVFFLGADAVDLSGVTISTVEEAALKRLAMKASQSTILLADHTKFGRRELAHVCRLQELHGIVTDAGIGQWETVLREQVAQVEVV